MHDYLRAVGFSSIRDKKDLERLLNTVVGAPESESEESISDSGAVYAEKSRDFAQNAGITVRGDFNENGIFTSEYYFPHYYGRNISLNEDLTAQKHADREEYDGICDLMDLGVSLIFHLNRLDDYNGDGVEYEKDESSGTDCATRYISNASVKLSALSTSGKVLIPLLRSSGQINKKRQHGVRHTRMIEAAKMGSQEAIENLTIEQLDTYAQAVKRLDNEDVLSVVETYFMPYGIACDQYSVLGDIIDCRMVCNQVTGETLCQMLVSANDIMLDICINKEDLTGVPEAGRRFLGNIWLQGVLA